MCSTWEGWAKWCCDAGASASAIYDERDGNVWGKSGELTCEGGGDLHSFDVNGDGKECCCPKVNGQKFFLVRKVEANKGKVFVYKGGDKSLVTVPGPQGTGARICAYSKEGKPEQLLNILKAVTD